VLPMLLQQTPGLYQHLMEVPQSGHRILQQADLDLDFVLVCQELRGLEAIPYARQFGEGELTPFQSQALLCEFLLYDIRLKQSSDDLSVALLLHLCLLRERSSVCARAMGAYTWFA
jgi:hypothetical protein